MFGKYHFSSMVPSGYRYIITFKWKPNFLGRLLGMEPTLVCYYGNSTVWYEFPSFTKCNTPTDEYLCDICKREKYFRGID